MGHNRAGDNRKRRERRRQKIGRRRRAKAMAARVLSLRKFSQHLVRGNRRKMLFAHLQEELGPLLRVCSEFRAWVFGSYLTTKRRPNDIDLLITCRVPMHQAGIVFQHLSHRRHREDVQMLHRCGSSPMPTKEQMIAEFNSQERNNASGISIADDDLIELTL